MLKDFVLALSLSNLCFIAAWRSLLFPSSSFYYYHLKTLPATTEYMALLLNVVLLATIFFLAIVLTRRSRKEWVKKCSRVLFILILSVPLYGVLMELDHPSVRKIMLPILSEPQAKRFLAAFGLTVCLFALVMMLLKIQRASKIAVAAILILAPLVPLTFSQAVLTAVKYRHAGSDQLPPAVVAQNGPRPRVLWLIFDELDFRTAFGKRSQTVALPELDRLAAESLVGVNAYPPAGETFLTLPALITGRLVSYAERRGPDELLVRFGEDTAPVSWRSQPSVFSRAREAGFNTALFGWYHPYCRILGSHLTKCLWEGKSRIWDTDNDEDENFSLPLTRVALGSRMYRHAVVATRAVPLLNVIYKPRVDPKAVLGKKLSIYESIYRQAIDAASDSEMGLVMVHWPIPHPPGIYDRASNSICVSAGQSYLDNLALVDRTFGEIRRSMEDKGVWDSTVVLVTSDHWWRTNYWKQHAVWTREDHANSEATPDRRIPFILKMAGTREPGISYESPFNTILTHDLLLSVLRGEVSDMKGAAAWIEHNRTIGRSPYDERTAR